MSRDTSVVTPERFARGLTYAEFLAQATVNVGQIRPLLSNVAADGGRSGVLRRGRGAARCRPAKILAIAEAWCGDVYRELPTVARIAEASGAELRIFLRDQNPDIMDEFLSNDGRSRAIPVVVFYSRDHRYIHALHRASRGRAEYGSRGDSGGSDRRPTAAPQARRSGTAPQDQRQAFITALVARTSNRACRSGSGRPSGRCDHC